MQYSHILHLVPHLRPSATSSPMKNRVGGQCMHTGLQLYPPTRAFRGEEVAEGRRWGTCNGIKKLLFLSNQLLRPITNRLVPPYKFLRTNNGKPELPVKVIRCRIEWRAVDFANQSQAVFHDCPSLQILIQQACNTPAPPSTADHHPVDIVKAFVACFQPVEIGIVVSCQVIKPHQQSTTVGQRPDVRRCIQQFLKCRNRLER